MDSPAPDITGAVQLIRELAKKKLAYYNRQATAIQRIWRGFYIRKYVHNFYARKAYLYALTIKNSEIKFVEPPILPLFQSIDPLLY